MKKKLIIILSIILSVVIVAGVVLGIVLTKPKEFTVTFDSDGGSQVQSQTIKKGELVNKPSNPTKEGYNFVAWCLEGKEWNFTSDKVEKEMTLKAKWEKEEDKEDPDEPTDPVVEKYNVTFMVDSATLGEVKEVEKDALVTAPVLEDKTGYDFIGWYKEDTYQTKWNFETDKVTENTTLYAKFEIKTFEVVFKNWDGTELKTENVEYGKDATAPTNPTKPEDVQYTYAFKEWDKSFTNITSNLEVTAMFTETLRSYEVSFVDGGSVLDTATKKYGEKVTKPADPSKIGYNFIGWYKESTFKNEYNFNDTITGTTTIYAKFEIKTFEVKFIVDGVETTQNVEYGQGATAPENPRKDSTAQYRYDFDKWDKAFDEVKSDLTVTAIFTQTLREYEVSFVDGSNVLSKVNNKYGESVTKPADSSKIGYDFIGWYKDSEFTQEYNFNDTITGTTIIYAKYQIKTFEVVFYDGDGEVFDRQFIEYGSDAKQRGVPTKTADSYKKYTFEKWDKAFTNITEDTDINAIFTAEDRFYEVTFKDGNGEIVSVQKVKAGEDAILPEEIPTKRSSVEYDYVFTSWQNGYKNILSDITIDAEFKVTPKTFVVAFYDGDKWLENQNVTYGSRATNKTIVKEGYELVGWSYNDVMWDFNYDSVYKDMTLYAVWKETNELFEFSTYQNGYSVRGVSGATYGETLTIPSTYNGKQVLKIEDNAFVDSNDVVKNIVVEDGIKEIGYEAFNCPVATSITLPTGITSIDENAFYWTAYWDNIDNWEGKSIYDLNLLYVGEYLIDAEIPVDVLPAYNDQSGYYEEFDNVTIKEGTTLIANKVFLEKDIVSVDFPTSLLYIGDYAFNRTQLCNVQLPNGVISLGDYAFAENYNLSSVTISNSVTSLGNYAFYSCTKLKEVVFEENSKITELPISVFEQCNILKNVDIPSSVTVIKESAFDSCKSIENIVIPRTVKKIGYRAFATENLKTIYIPKEVEEIDRNMINTWTTAFCENEIAPSGWLENWNGGASKVYYGIQSPNEYVAKDDITYLISGDEAVVVKVSGQITNVIIPESVEINGTTYTVTKIARKTFFVAYNVEEVKLPNTLREIEREAFDGLNNVTSIIIPASVETIGSMAFYNANIKIYCEAERKPANWSNIWNYGNAQVYWNYTGNNEVTISGITYSIYNGKAEITNVDKNITSAEIPEEVNINGKTYAVTSIPANAFAYCTELTNVVLTQNIIEIGERAFSGCSKLESINLEQVVRINVNAFNDCTKLAEMYISNSVEKIGEYTFYNCPNLVIYCEVTEEESKVAPYNFGSNWNYYRPVYWGVAESDIVTLDGVKYLLQDDETAIVVGFDETSGSTADIQGEIVVNNATYSVTKIGTYAFNNCTNLTSVLIPESIIEIGDYAFRNCTNLKTISLPITIEKVGAQIFNNCTGMTIYVEANSKPAGWDSSWANSGNGKIYYMMLEEINVDGVLYSIISNTETDRKVAIIGYTANEKNLVIPSTITYNGLEYNVDTIKVDAFKNCKNLISVHIPHTVNKVERYAFRGCENTCVYLETIGTPSGYDLSGTAYTYYVINQNTYLEQDGIIYHKPDNSVEVIVTGTTDNVPNVVAIPEEVNINGSTYKVTSIGKRAFANCSNITNVTIPSTIDTINEYAFNNCSNLEYIYIPSSVEFVYNYAFYYCYNATLYAERTSQPSGWTSSSLSFGVYAKYWGVSETDFVVEGGLQYVIQGDSAEVSGSAKNDGDVEILTEVVIKGNAYPVTSIGASAFNMHNNIKTIYIPDSITSIKDSAFKQCNSLEYVYIPASVETMERWAFGEMSNTVFYIERLEAPTTWDLMWINGTYSCPIYYGVTRDDFVVNSYGQYVIISENAEFSKAPRNTANVEILGEVDINGGTYTVTNINRDAMAGSVVESVIIPNTITEIPSSLFYNQKRLSSVTFEEGINLTAINENAFYGCESLISFEIPDTVTLIDYSAFENCINLESVFIPASVKVVGIQAFYNCRKLTITIDGNVDMTDWDSNWNYSNSNVVFVGEGGKIEAQIDGVVYELSGDGTAKILGNKFTTYKKELVVPEKVSYNDKQYTVTSINSSAFSSCGYLNSVVLPDTITEIGEAGFNSCGALTTINIPKNLKTLGNAVFGGCFNLKEVNLPKSLTKMGSSVFNTCCSLTSITFEEGITLTTISGSMFSNCYSLKTIILPNTITWIASNAFYNCASLESIVIPENVEFLDDNVFYNCRSLTSVTFETNKIQEIMYKTFYGCNSLTNITIPTSVQSINSYAFANCSSLESIVIPANVIIMGANAFSNCVSLNSVTFETKRLITIASQTFYGCSSLTSITIPANVSKIEYQAFKDCTSLSDVIILNENCTVDDTAFENCIFQVA